MLRTAVDTSVLLVLLKREPDADRWATCLNQAATEGVVIASPIVVAELRAFFSSNDACQATLLRMGVQFSPLSMAASLEAGRIFAGYRAAGGKRNTILPDFLIASHAHCEADQFATCDRGFMRAYFPKLRLLGPTEMS